MISPLQLASVALGTLALVIALTTFGRWPDLWRFRRVVLPTTLSISAWRASVDW